MDSTVTELQCKNSADGCTFTSSSVEDMVSHFQEQCTFHRVQCFRCNNMVRKDNFTQHYQGDCKDTAEPPYTAPDRDSGIGQTEGGNTTMSRKLHSLQQSVRECTSGVKNMSTVMKNVAPDVAELKLMNEKQQELEASLKVQIDAIRELSKCIMWLVEKVDQLQQCVHSTVKESFRESKLDVERLYSVVEDVAADVIEVKLMREEQYNLEAAVRQQGDLMKGFEIAMRNNAEMVGKVQKSVGIIVERVAKVESLDPTTGQSWIYWYVENVSRYIEESKTKPSSVCSDVFVVRGYSARLAFELRRDKTEIHVGIYFYLRRGPNDSLLRWPFVIPYTLSLIHPNDASKTKEHKVTPPDGHPTCFEKPKEERNRGLGTSSLCTVDELQNEGFIENDAVCFSLTLDEFSEPRTRTEGWNTFRRDSVSLCGW